MRIAAIVVPSTVLLAASLKTLKNGGTRASTLLLSAVGTFGEVQRRVRNLRYALASTYDTFAWAWDQERIARRYRGLSDY